MVENSANLNESSKTFFDSIILSHNESSHRDDVEIKEIIL